MSNAFSHFDEHGQARMVDVGSKAVTERVARASSKVTMQRATADLIRQGEAGKGDVLGIARVAGIMAAKQTPQLIPLCHPLSLSKVELELEFADSHSTTHQTLNILGTVKVQGQTGVEMEALTAVSIAALTVYDMCKSVDRDMIIGPTQLEEKSGGKSGQYRRPAPPDAERHD